MIDPVVWWLSQDDQAVHAFRRAEIGQGRPYLHAMCSKVVAAWRVDRNARGSRCVACQASVTA